MAIHAEYNGIEFDFDNSALDTWDAFELLADVEDGNVLAAVKLARLVFGKEQLQRIKGELHSEKAVDMLTFVNGAIMAAAEKKGETPKN